MQMTEDNYIDFKPMPGYIHFVRLNEGGEVSLDPSPGLLILRDDGGPNIVPAEWCDSYVDVSQGSWDQGPEHYIQNYRNRKWKLDSINAGKRRSRKPDIGGYTQRLDIVITFTHKNATVAEPFSQDATVIVVWPDDSDKTIYRESRELPMSVWEAIEDQIQNPRQGKRTKDNGE